MAVATAGGAQACELPEGKRLEGKQLSLSYRSAPPKIVVGEHFEVIFGICGKENADFTGPIRVDAHMPEHRHGMNYKPRVAQLGGGRYRSQGWLFHMPGRWEFVFELGGERLADSVRIE